MVHENWFGYGSHSTTSKAYEELGMYLTVRTSLNGSEGSNRLGHLGQSFESSRIVFDVFGFPTYMLRTYNMEIRTAAAIPHQPADFTQLNQRSNTDDLQSKHRFTRAVSDVCNSSSRAEIVPQNNNKTLHQREKDEWRDGSIHIGLSRLPREVMGTVIDL